MAGISSKAAGSLENKKKYNGIEFDNDFDINTYEAELRNLDPQIGRWWQIDPEIENMEMWSPYVSNYDNPILYKDPRGNKGEGCCGGLWDAIADGVDKVMLNVSGAVFGSLNMATNGLFPTDPFNITPNLTSEEKMWFNNGTQGAMTAAAILPMGKSGEVVGETPQVRVNAQKGAAWEKQVAASAKETQTGVVEQITVKTKLSGTKTRLDVVGKDKQTNQHVLTEAKSSETAPLSTKQKKAFPEIQQAGATVVGKGKPGVPGGTEIPPTTVIIKRPPIQEK